MEKVSDDPRAPFGYGEDGTTPKAPYGLKVDGTPRLSNRGAKAGGNRSRGRGSRAPRPGKTINTSDRQRRDSLIGLADMLVITPLSGLSASPQVAARLGKKHADAFAGDAVIIQQHVEPLADALIELSHTKPGLLSWLDNVEQNAPWIPLAMVGLQMTKAFVENHTNPNPDLVVAGKLMSRVKQAQMIALIHEQAREMGISVDDVEMGISDGEPTEVIPAA